MIRIRLNAFALPLHGIARVCTDTDASRLQVRVGGFNLLSRHAGAAEQRQHFGSRMGRCFVKIPLIATVAAAVAAITCSSAYAQSNLGSMRAQYSSGNPQRGGPAGSDSSLSPLLGSPPDYEMNYLSGDDASSSTRSQTSARDGQTRNTKSSQSARISSLYGAPKDFEDSYSARFGNQPGKMDGARHSTSYGLAAVEGLSPPGARSGGRASAGKGTLRRNAGGVRSGQSGNSDMSGSQNAAPASSFVTRTDLSGGRDPATSVYRSPW
ncbi:hypothetical protein SAMN05446635_6672 [Burkholderia sp. OK233]|nr:hypothetical protein SAMN05446635_6672 [Burkholderia sp. OK233]